MFRLFRLWRLSARDLRLLWFALRHPGRPAWLLPATLLLIFCAVDPLNLALPAFGIVDELVILPLLLHLLVRFLPAEIRAGATLR
jgi:uncharacterized membrane protein YkvA (DUF1232 family)